MMSRSRSPVEHGHAGVDRPCTRRDCVRQFVHRADEYEHGGNPEEEGDRPVEESLEADEATEQSPIKRA